MLCEAICVMRYYSSVASCASCSIACLDSCAGFNKCQTPAAAAAAAAAGLNGPHLQKNLVLLLLLLLARLPLVVVVLLLMLLLLVCPGCHHQGLRMLVVPC
jgi:hypothetical protein